MSETRHDDKERPELEHPLRMLRNATMRVGSFGNMNIEVVRRDEAESILRDALRPVVVAALATPAPAAPLSTALGLADDIERFVNNGMTVQLGTEQCRMVIDALRSSRSAGMSIPDPMGNELVARLRFLVQERRHVQLGVVDADLIAAADLIERLEKEQADNSMSVLVPLDEYERLKACAGSATVASTQEKG